MLELTSHFLPARVDPGSRVFLRPKRWGVNGLPLRVAFRRDRAGWKRYRDCFGASLGLAPSRDHPLLAIR